MREVDADTEASGTHEEIRRQLISLDHHVSPGNPKIEDRPLNTGETHDRAEFGRVLVQKLDCIRRLTLELMKIEIGDLEVSTRFLEYMRRVTPGLAASINSIWLERCRRGKLVHGEVASPHSENAGHWFVPGPNVLALSRGGGEADDVGCSAMLGGAIIFSAESKQSPSPRNPPRGSRGAADLCR